MKKKPAFSASPDGVSVGISLVLSSEAPEGAEVTSLALDRLGLSWGWSRPQLVKLKYGIV